MKNFNKLTASFLVIGGLKIFPCREGGPSAKAPYTRRGFKEASNDGALVSAWSSQFPNALWGLPCAMNGVLVPDADLHGNGDGVSNVKRLFEHNQFDCHQIPMVATPRGGYHFYFRGLIGWGKRGRRSAMRWTSEMMLTLSLPAARWPMAALTKWSKAP
jgi:hypothetical protein